MRSQSTLNIAIAVLLTLFSLATASGAQKPPFTVTISAPATVVAGGDLFVEVETKNVSKEAIQIVWGELYTIMVRDESGKEVAPKPGTRGGSSALVSVEPGMALKDRVPLSSNYDLTELGKYVVQVTRPLHHDDPKSDRVQSNAITITVVPRK